MTSGLLVESAQSTQKMLVMVSFKDKVDLSLIEAYGGEIVYTSVYKPLTEAYLSQSDIDALKLEPSIEYAEIEEILHLSDEYLPWGVERIRADLVWDKNGDLISDPNTPSGQGITVAVLDTGIDYNHTDLKDRVVNGTSFVENVTSYMDDNGHGTWVAGVIAASDNGNGIVGVAPRVDLFAVKVADSQGAATVVQVIDGIYWSVEQGANIISMSLGGINVDIYDFELACFDAYHKGVLLVAASGNDNKPEIEYPAKYSWTVAVGAVDQNDGRWVSSPTRGSNYGSELDFVAPGQNIYTTSLNGTYETRNGTSYAVPHVSGLAALIWSSEIDPDYDKYNETGWEIPDGKWESWEVEAKIRDTALDLGDSGKDDYYGYGLVNALYANQRPPGNINNDSRVNLLDLVPVAARFGKNLGDPEYDPNRDINIDKKINLLDLVKVAMNFGKERASGEGAQGQGSEGDGFRSLGEGGTEVSVYPNLVTSHKHEVFSVNITVADVAGMYGWEFKLYWDNGLLNCTNVEIFEPDVWSENTFPAGPGIENNFNATHGRYWKALTAQNPAPTFNGTTTMATLTFKALAHGTSTLDLVDVILADKNATEISHTTADGSANIVPRKRYMRGDQHTVNGLNAYQLMTIQSSTGRFVSEGGSGGPQTAYWGVRVWKRDQNGSETEITNGTPVAQVSRYSRGWGIQSNTWNCPATGLNPTDTVVVRVYIKFDTDEWQLCASFTTDQLDADQLDSATWTTYYYTWYYYNRVFDVSLGRFYWGTPTYNSHIKNLEHT